MDFIVVVALAALLIGLSKGGLGGPVPIALITPLLSQVMPAQNAVSLALPLLLIGDGFALRLYWREWDTRQIRLMLPPAVIGVAVGLLVLATISDLALRRVLGLFALAVILYKLASDRLTPVTYRPRRWHGSVTGAASGFSSALANTGAPPFTAYMLLQDVSPRAFIGTSTLFFAIVNALKIPGILGAELLDFQQLYDSLWALPLIPLGVWLGRKLIEWMNPKVFEWVMLAMLFVASVALLFSAPQ